MTYKRVLTIQDISCFGQCSLTVALPILSACGMETVILPSAILSTHTAGFSGFTCRDLTDDMPSIAAHWEKENIRFDILYTGYLGSTRQMEDIKSIIQTLLRRGAPVIVDPAMADNGKLYPAFDEAYVKAMLSLCREADIILPNITEACFLTGMAYRETYDRSYIDELLDRLTDHGIKTVILTGVSYAEGKTGVVVYENRQYAYYEHRRIAQGCHGTGDVYASAFVGAIANGKSTFDAASVAADYTVACIEYTQGDAEHRYGVKFEPLLGDLIRACKA